MHEQPHDEIDDTDDDESPADTIYDVEHGTQAELAHILEAAAHGRAFPAVFAALTADEDTVRELQSLLDRVAVGGSLRVAIAVDSDYDAVGLLNDEVDACEDRLIAALQTRDDVWTIRRTHYALPEEEDAADDEMDDEDVEYEDEDMEEWADDENDSDDDDMDDVDDDVDVDDEPDRVASVMRLTRTA